MSRRSQQEKVLDAIDGAWQEITVALAYPEVLGRAEMAHLRGMRDRLQAMAERLEAVME